MSGTRGHKSAHCLANTGPRRFLVCEFDSGDEDGRVFGSREAKSLGLIDSVVSGYTMPNTSRPPLNPEAAAHARGFSSAAAADAYRRAEREGRIATFGHGQFQRHPIESL